MSQEIEKVSIKTIEDLTSDAKKITFEIPASLQEKFAFTSGQYITLVFHIDDKEYRRCYSLCSAPYETEFSVGVKRVIGGVVSNYIHDELKVGDKVDVIEPEGRFVHKCDPQSARQYYMFAAGSGITPILSHVKTILEEEPLSTVYLLYGNREQSNIMFEKELDALNQKYANQFVMRHTFSSLRKSGFFSNIFGSSRDGKNFAGRIDKSTIKAFLKDHPMKSNEALAMVCGPGNLNEKVPEILQKHNFKKDNILTESFGLIAGGAANNHFEGVASVMIHLDGQEIPMELTKEDTVLQSLLDEDYQPPYSCQSGVCSSCIAKLVKGEVTMDISNALDEDEIADGYILTCQSRPASEDIEIKYI